ncbi:MAG: hypothetical protein ABSG94_11425 [Brevinematales bacterium]|jgi:hypothetical protein
MKTEKSPFFLQALNIAGFAIMITINALANIVRFNGRGTGDVSNEYKSLFTPAGITFSIWGVIYLLLLVFIIYQARDMFGRVKNTLQEHERTGLFFFLSCLANSFWIFAWHFEMIELSLLVMVLLLATLITIYTRLGIGIRSSSTAQKLCLHLPFSIYLGWISVATIANAAAVLVKIRWDRFGINDLYWAIAMIIVAAILALAVLIRRNDIFYTLVILWAFTGIIIKHLTPFTDVSLNIIMTASVCMVIIALGMILRFRKWLKY